MAIVVPLNVIFGVVTALALVRGNFRGKRVIESVVDLPFAVSPVVVGVSLILLWGIDGWFGGLGRPRHQGHLLAARHGDRDDLRDAAFVVREVEPVLHEIGDEQEQAAATLGASWRQTFWRITLPAIRWGLLYGVVLTVARSLGEFGALIVVAGASPASRRPLRCSCTRAISMTTTPSAPTRRPPS